MKPVGHLRYAWIALQDARGHLDQVSDREAHCEAALAMLGEACDEIRPVLERAESATHNDNGETPLEWAREALAAHRRFLHCWQGLGRHYDQGFPFVKEATQEMQDVTTVLEWLVATLEKKART